MKTNINFKQLAMADLDINSNIEPISKEVEQALSNFLKNRKKRKNRLENHKNQFFKENRKGFSNQTFKNNQII